MAPRVPSKDLQILIDRYIGDDPERIESFERTCADFEVSVLINRLRTEAGLTMKQLADRVGTQPSVIARLERADYEGHSLSMLRRIAGALGRRVEISFPPIESEAHAKLLRNQPANVTTAAVPRRRRKPAEPK